MRRLGEEAGQSLVELLVTLALGLVVLTATLATFESFNSTARSTDAVVDVQDQARSQLDRLTRDVRGALPPVAGADAIVVPAATSPAAAVQSDELVVGRVTDTTAGTTAMVLRRWCVASGTLWREDLAGPTDHRGRALPVDDGRGPAAARHAAHRRAERGLQPRRRAHDRPASASTSPPRRAPGARSGRRCAPRCGCARRRAGRRRRRSPRPAPRAAAGCSP